MTDAMNFAIGAFAYPYLLLVGEHQLFAAVVGLYVTGFAPSSKLVVCLVRKVDGELGIAAFRADLFLYAFHSAVTFRWRSVSHFRL